MKFNRVKFDKLDGTVAVRHTLEKEGAPEFYLEAGRQGVTLKGEILLESQSDLQAFAKVMGAAWTDHKTLKPKIATSLSGH